MNIADQNEVHIVAGHAVVGELGHGQRRDSRTLRVAEHHDGIFGAHPSAGDLAFDIRDHDLLALSQRRAELQAFDTGKWIQPVGYERRLGGAGEAQRLQIQRVGGIYGLRGRYRATAAVKHQGRTGAERRFRGVHVDQLDFAGLDVGCQWGRRWRRDQPGAKKGDPGGGVEALFLVHGRPTFSRDQRPRSAQRPETVSESRLRK